MEDSDLLGTKQLLQANENLVNTFVSLSLSVAPTLPFAPCRYNEHDWCPLDIAIMLNNISMIRLLLHYGGEESLRSRPSSVCIHALTNSIRSPTRRHALSQRLPTAVDARRAESGRTGEETIGESISTR